jgi:hypothetical protein
MSIARPSNNEWAGRNLPLPYAYCPIRFTAFLGPVTRDPVWALSTLYRAHCSYSFLFIACDDHEVSFLDGA